MRDLEFEKMELQKTCTSDDIIGVRGSAMSIMQALVTALLSGLFSGAILFALNERRDRQKLLLEKAELAVEAYSDWADTLSNWPILQFDMFKDDRAEGRRKADEHWKEARKQFIRARLLIGIYLPEQRGRLAELVAATNDFITFRRDLALDSINGKPLPPGASETITNTSTNIVRVGQDCVEKLLAAAQSRAHSPHLIRAPAFPRLSRATRKE